MKTRFLFLLLLISAYSFSQSVNDYKAVIVPLKYDFLKSENQYRLSTLTKFNLQKAGFTAFYTNESIPSEYSDRCGLLYADVKKENAFLTTKLYIVFKDCKGTVVFQSAVGKSKEKEYEVAYTDALVDAFKSVYALNYKYNGAASSNIVEVVPTQSQVIAAVPAIVDAKDLNILYAQPTASGFQLVDSTPKVILKLLRTSRNDTFIATKEGVQGVLIAKSNQWFFEYYQNNQLISEQIGVKF
jgi:hypothetical protein